MDITSKQKRIQTWKAILSEMSSANPQRATLEREVASFADLIFKAWSTPPPLSDEMAQLLQTKESLLETAFEDLRVSAVSNIPTAKSGTILYT